VHSDAAATTSAAAGRLVARLAEVLGARPAAHLVVTGGGAGIRTLADVRALPAGGGVDWPRVHVWWGDERFLPPGDPERNDTQAREALLDHVPVRPDHVHPVPGPDAAADPEAAAVAYAAELARHADVTDRPAVPRFDVLLLGIGPDGHVASLFPEHPQVHEGELTVVGVRGSPKPPPERVSLTFPAINAADEVWVLATGEEKAPAVALALGGAGPVQVPAAGVSGRRRTEWLLDRVAARDLPPGLARIASP
jgi:6-phosphogluconolactonase